MKIRRVYLGSQLKGGGWFLTIGNEVDDLVKTSVRNQKDRNAGVQPSFSHTVKIPDYGIVPPTLKMVLPSQVP